jgi:hypothetical protein
MYRFSSLLFSFLLRFGEQVEKLLQKAIKYAGLIDGSFVDGNGNADF